MLELYKNIKKRRLELNMTQSDLAKKLGYADKSMIAKIEKGIVDLPQSKIVAFAEALESTPEILMGWRNTDSNSNVITLKERIVGLCKQENIPISKLEKELGFAGGYISKLDKSTPNSAKLQKIAEYFGVTLDYLMTGKEKTSPYKEITLTVKDERDIAIDIDVILSKLRSGENGPASYDGEEIQQDDIDLFAGQLELMLKRLKAMNKEKYNPGKNKK